MCLQIVSVLWINIQHSGKDATIPIGISSARFKKSHVLLMKSKPQKTTTRELSIADVISDLSSSVRFCSVNVRTFFDKADNLSKSIESSAPKGTESDPSCHGSNQLIHTDGSF